MSISKIKLRAPEFKRTKKETPTEQLYKILNVLRDKQIITDADYSKLARPIKKPMTQELLVEALVKVGALEPYQPLDESVKDFMEELGSLDSSDLVGFSEDLRQDRKGLNDMTPIPQKKFPIPGNIIFYTFIGLAIFLVIVGSSWSMITQGMHGGTGATGNPLSGLLGSFGVKFILGLFA